MRDVNINININYGHCMERIRSKVGGAPPPLGRSRFAANVVNVGAQCT